MSETIILITGANQGLGFEMVKRLAREGSDYRVILCSRDVERGKKAAATISPSAQNTVDVVQLDVTSDESITRAVTTVEGNYGRLDVLVNNAGVGMSAEASPRQQMLDVFNVNVASVFMVTDAFIPLLRKSKAPRIIMVSSNIGSITNTLDPNDPFFSIDNKPYKVSKSAVNMLGATFSAQYGKEGFRVNAVNPGFRATNMNGYHESAGKAEDGALEVCRLIALGDKGGTGTFTEIEGPLKW